MVLLDKPAAVSSHTAISALRGELGRRVGHAGTLDPFATGLLLVLHGRATRLAGYVAALPKRYEATLQFGATSTTHDPEGEITPTGQRLARSALVSALPGFRGRIEQVPPAASAVRVDGERAYRRFRRGERFSPPARSVEVYELELIRFDADSQQAGVRIRCSSGTYVRALARDIGVVVGAGAYCTALRRDEQGCFRLADAGSIDDIRADPFSAVWWRSPRQAVVHLASRDLSPSEAGRIGHGGAISVQGETGLVALVAAEALVGIGRVHDDRLAPVMVLEAR
jgi:tRNA pseudouridine55 synthase